jgi:hypothetical protein
MEQIIELLSAKLPMELVHKIVYEYGGVITPTAILIKNARRVRCDGIYAPFPTKQYLSLARGILEYRDSHPEEIEHPYICYDCLQCGPTYRKALRHCRFPHLPCGWDPHLSNGQKIDRITAFEQRYGRLLKGDWATMRRIIARCDTYREADDILMTSPRNTELLKGFIRWIFAYKPRFNLQLDRWEND